jgi:hypothetical protein
LGLFSVYLSENQINMNKLLMFAKNIEDFRMERKKLHPAENIVFITVLAVICNATDWEEIEDFGKFRGCRKYTDYTDCYGFTQIIN